MSLHCCFAVSPCTSPPLPCHCFALLRLTAALSRVSLLQSAAHTVAMLSALLRRTRSSDLLHCRSFRCNVVRFATMHSTMLQCSPICCNAVHSAASYSPPQSTAPTAFQCTNYTNASLISRTASPRLCALPLSPAASPLLRVLTSLPLTLFVVHHADPQRSERRCSLACTACVPFCVRSTQFPCVPCTLFPLRAQHADLWCGE